MFTERVQSAADLGAATPQHVLDAAEPRFRASTIRQIAKGAWASVGTAMDVGGKDGLLVTVARGGDADRLMRSYR